MAKQLDETPIWPLVQEVLSSGPTSTNYTWEVTIHTPQEVVVPINVMSINTLRDYAGAFGDELMLTVQIGRGTFAHRILPYRDNLEITLKKVPVDERLTLDTSRETIQSERFKANLSGDYVSPTLGQGKEAKSEQALNSVAMDDIHFQLQDKACEQLRVMMVGGPGRRLSVQDYLAFSILFHTQELKVGAERALQGFEMVPAHNKDIKEQIVVTQGIRLVDLADFIQKRYGVYNSGIGSYIQGRCWYIYPLYDTTEFNRRKTSLVLVVVPSNKMSDVERTFIIKAGVVTALVTGTTAFRDDAGTNYQNFGNGVRFTNADRLMDLNDDVKDNKLDISRAKHNSEFVVDNASLKFAPVSSDRITANPFAVLSLQAAKRGGMFRAVWQNADHSLIVPGMAVRVVYVENDLLKDVYGIVHAVTFVSHKPGGITSRRFVNHAVLDVFVNNQLRPVDD